MFITAICLLFLLKLKWPKNRSVYDLIFVLFSKIALSTKFCNEGQVSIYNVICLLDSNALAQKRLI